jgi:hypothetical protein
MPHLMALLPKLKINPPLRVMAQSGVWVRRICRQQSAEKCERIGGDD